VPYIRHIIGQSRKCRDWKKSDECHHGFTTAKEWEEEAAIEKILRHCGLPACALAFA
jgi:hypothetical protein